MIARIWSGVTSHEQTEEYLAYVEKTGVEQTTGTPGNRGTFVLQRRQEDGTEFMVISLWESYEAIRRFAGPATERAVYYPEDRKFLRSLEPQVRHYEVPVAPPALQT